MTKSVLNIRVATYYGDLILDQAFQGKVYLRGLLLPSSTLDSNPFKLGYNFIKGRVNRDRQRLADDLEEADLVTRIWESAIEKEETVLLPIYVNLSENSLAYATLRSQTIC